MVGVNITRARWFVLGSARRRPRDHHAAKVAHRPRVVAPHFHWEWRPSFSMSSSAASAPSRYRPQWLSSRAAFLTDYGILCCSPPSIAIILVVGALVRRCRHSEGPSCHRERSDPLLTDQRHACPRVKTRVDVCVRAATADPLNQGMPHADRYGVSSTRTRCHLAMPLARREWCASSRAGLLPPRWSHPLLPSTRDPSAPTTPAQASPQHPAEKTPAVAVTVARTQDLPRLDDCAAPPVSVQHDHAQDQRTRYRRMLDESCPVARADQADPVGGLEVPAAMFLSGRLQRSNPNGQLTEPSLQLLLLQPSVHGYSARPI